MRPDAWRLRLIDPPRLGPWEELRGGGRIRRRPLEMNTCWFATPGAEGRWYSLPDRLYPPLALDLSAHYHRHLAAVRAPLLVCLPGAVVVCVDAPGSHWHLDAGAPGLALYLLLPAAKAA